LPLSLHQRVEVVPLGVLDEAEPEPMLPPAEPVVEPVEPVMPVEPDVSDEPDVPVEPEAPIEVPPPVEPEPEPMPEPLLAVSVLLVDGVVAAVSDEDVGAGTLLVVDEVEVSV